MAFNQDAFEGLLIDGVKPTGKILGKGAYGKVIEVTWNGTVCAAKQVHEVFLDEVSPAEKARVVRDFQREFQTWAKLRHPNIVILLGVYFINGSSSPQIVLEKMDTSLRNYLEKQAKGDFPLVHKVDVLKQIAQGLSYLHHLNPPLVHHDLSPNNVLLNEVSFTTKLTDFGMTRAVNPSALTRMSSVKGTLAFMAPEALRNPPHYNDKLDMFSYGNIIISTVTHEWPTPCDPNRYEGEKLIALTEYQRREQYMKLFSVEESKLLSDMVQRCLENRPDRRPSSVILVDELDVVSKSFVSSKAWVEQVLELKQDKQQLATQVTALQGDIVHLREDKVHLQEGKQQLASQVTALQGDIVRLRQDKVHLQEDKQQLATRVTTLQEDNVRLQEDKVHLQEDKQQLATRVTTLQGDIVRLQGNNATLQMLQECVQEENAALQENSVCLQKEIGNLQEGRETLQKHCTILEQKNVHLRAIKHDKIPRYTTGVETQLKECRPLMNAKVQENDIWYVCTYIRTLFTCSS